MANRSVVLYLRTKIKGKWAYQKVAEELSQLDCGEYYLSWYINKRKHLEPAGTDPETVLAALQLKRLGMAYVAAGGVIQEENKKKVLQDAFVAAGGKIEPAKSQTLEQLPHVAAQDETKQGEPPTISSNSRTLLTAAVQKYLEVCDERKGKSGYGLAVRTPKTYADRLCYLTEFRPEAYMDEVDKKFIEEFRSFLLKHKKDLSDRTSYNIMQAVSTFLIRNENGVAKSVLREMEFEPTEVITYSKEELKRFFIACDEEEELLFKFFLHSMARDMEVANCEVRDLNFDKNILHICPKPHRNFRLKGKRSGQAKKGRKVPIPALFMARMNEFCKGKRPRDLIFSNGKGGVEQHFLRRCERIAKRAGLNWQDFDLHRWRKTGATRHHENGVSVRKIQAWLGHESLEVTLDYLGVDDAADDISQEQVNNGALAAYV
ncbi:MAG TPA: tyrosine-type recombinase/integrase [Terracidiphilus sp.]|nr:tyrosine-type recombinase/integrase [Terracidiphilus sp.]